MGRAADTNACPTVITSITFVDGRLHHPHVAIATIMGGRIGVTPSAHCGQASGWAPVKSAARFDALFEDICFWRIPSVAGIRPHG